MAEEDITITESFVHVSPHHNLSKPGEPFAHFSDDIVCFVKVAVLLQRVGQGELRL